MTRKRENVQSGCLPALVEFAFIAVRNGKVFENSEIHLFGFADAKSAQPHCDFGPNGEPFNRLCRSWLVSNNWRAKLQLES